MIPVIVEHVNPMSRTSSGKQAAACLRFDERPTTPKNIRKYRKSYFEQPGARVTHPGLIEENERLNERLAGQRLGSRSNRKSEHMGDLFNDGPTGSLGDYVEERKESIYKTKQLEPLGKPYVRGHKFDGLATAKPQANTSESAKDLIYTMGSEESKSEEQCARIRKQYILSHNSYEVGERKDRNYRWTREPTARVETEPEEGVAYCLKQPDSLAEEKLDTEEALAVASYRAMHNDQLGKAKYRGNLDADTVARLEERLAERQRESNTTTCTAQDCVEGDYTIEQQLPDADLGRATRPGWRNTDTERVFGASTVRTDKPAPKVRSISDNQNYGDNTNAKTLLYPSPFVAAGIEDSDFEDPADPEDIRTIMDRIGYSFGDQEFDKLYARSCLISTGDLTDRGRYVVSIKTFLNVANERFRCLDEGFEPSWW